MAASIVGDALFCQRGLLQQIVEDGLIPYRAPATSTGPRDCGFPRVECCCPRSAGAPALCCPSIELGGPRGVLAERQSGGPVGLGVSSSGRAQPNWCRLRRSWPPQWPRCARRESARSRGGQSANKRRRTLAYYVPELASAPACWLVSYSRHLLAANRKRPFSAHPLEAWRGCKPDLPLRPDKTWVLSATQRNAAHNTATRHRCTHRSPAETTMAAYGNTGYPLRPDNPTRHPARLP